MWKYIAESVGFACQSQEKRDMHIDIGIEEY